MNKSFNDVLLRPNFVSEPAKNRHVDFAEFKAKITTTWL